MSTRIPVTVLTGFLGAGKTTLLNRILTGDHGRRYGVIVNEFGEIGIDGDLIKGADEELIEMTNGCVCCTVRGDLVRAARTMLAPPRRFDAMVVETTGLARPGPIAQTFLLDAVLAQETVIDSLTCLVDARHVAQALADSAVAAEQIAVADQILLNKADLVADPAPAEALLRDLNQTAPIYRTVQADIPLDTILGRGAFDLARLDGALDADDHHHHDHGSDHHHADAHLHGIDSVSLTAPEAMDFAKLETWLGDYLGRHGEDVLRMKGLLAIAGEDRQLAVQAVHALFTGDWARPWRQGEARRSRLVFIGRNLDEAALEAGLRACVAT